MNGHPFCLGGSIHSIPAALAILPWTILKNRMNSSFSFKSSWCNSCNFILFFKSSYSAIHPILQIVLVPFILFLKPFWCNSSYYSKSSETKQLVRQGIEQILTPIHKRRPFPFLLSLSFFYGAFLTFLGSLNLLCVITPLVV